MSDRTDISRLLERHYTGVATDDDRRQLAQMIEQDPALIQRIYQEASLELDLHAVMPRCREVIEETAVSGRTSWWWRLAPLAAAAAVAVGLFAWWMSESKTSLDLPQVAGRTIEVGEVARVPETEDVELVYADGTTIRLKEGSVFTVLTPTEDYPGKRLSLAKGWLEADVAKQPVGKPFVIETSAARFTVVGTRFDLTVQDGNTVMARLNVTEGVVRAEADGRSWDVAANQSLTLGGDLGTLQKALNFNDYIIEPYGQRATGNLVVEDNGATLRMRGSLWLRIALPTTVTTNTVLEFDFRSARVGDIQGIGFETDNTISPEISFQLYGSQDWGLNAFKDYSGTDWKHYVIPVGQYFTGAFGYLTFLHDDDLPPYGESAFRNVKVYETTPVGVVIHHGDTD